MNYWEAFVCMLACLWFMFWNGIVLGQLDQVILWYCIGHFFIAVGVCLIARDSLRQVYAAMGYPEVGK